MTTNVFDDNSALWAASLNAMANADAGEAIVSGCSVSKGSGDWDSDITSGTVRIGGASVSVSADTVTHTDSSGLASGESRVDIITADSAGALSITEGTGATDPARPDIPTDEVVVGFWIIAEGDATLAAADLFDVPALFTDQTDPIYGDGSDGAITRSSNGNENGLIYATTYEVESGVTMTVSNGVLVVHATESIAIDGTLTATGQGHAGGSGGGGGSGDGGNGSNGNGPGDIGGVSGSGGSSGGQDGGAGAGGAGGDSPEQTFGDGGDAGGAASFSANQLRQLRTITGTEWDTVYDLSMVAGSGGGGGGGGAGNGNSRSGGNGGDGGDGGGVILLIAPTITITGSVTADGEDGANATNNDWTGGGGGGGGSGGLLAVFATNYTNSGTATAAAGSGGAGGTDVVEGDGGDGGDGGAGLAVTPA